MSRLKAKSSREVGLEIAAICGRHFFKLEHLHYGYWTYGLEIDIANLHIAQQNYTNLLVSHIPDGVKTILDVGCGTGRTAQELIGRGYQVDCVSPSPFLSERVRSLLGNTSRIFECPYEQLQTELRYDVVLFSESFQYVRLEEGLQQTVGFLNDGGYLFICDFFKTDAEGNGVLGGGHKLTRFRARMADYPFEAVVDEDITPQTAPTMDIWDDAVKNVVAPVLDSGLGYLSGRHPLAVKLLRWKYRKKIDRMYEKYFNGGRSSQDFKRFKTYRLLLYRKTSPNADEQGEQQ
jgi:SAM-dependent methyltransferase